MGHDARQATVLQTHYPGRTVDHAAAATTVQPPYDAVVVSALDTASMREAAACLAPMGMLYWPAAPDDAACAAAGLRRYQATAPAGTALVHGDYDPAAHARQLLGARRPAWAYEVLLNVPNGWVQDLETQAALAVARQLCLLTLARPAGPATRLRHFFAAQQAFFLASYSTPLHPEPYGVQAAFWRTLGDERMARRLLDSHACAAGLDMDETPLPLAPAYNRAAPPPMHIPAGPMRLLVIIAPIFDPAMDVLYDGLVRLLGAENVTEFPWKPSLHGSRHRENEDYPIAFDHPGAPKEREQVCAMLRNQAFDAILFADMRPCLEHQAIEALMTAAGNTPVFAVDGWDDCSDLQGFLAQLLGRPPRAYFKRELIACHDYGPRAIPLPLSYPEGFMPPEDRATRRDLDLFWAGRRVHGMRRLFLEHLEAVLGRDLDPNYTQEAYAASLGRARFALSLCGFGFDTLRYWEAPAHGALLVAEKPPIVLPNDFTDGQNALLFNDLPELVEKLRYGLEQPPETLAAMAAAGQAHVRRHHTNTARASQLLGHMARLLPTA
ncbi:MAG: glycosyltransferase [Candidatus Hydrogenedentota bacterium]